MNEIESECCYLFPTYKLKQSWFVRSYLLNFLWTYTPYDIVKVVHLSTKKKQPPPPPGEGFHSTLYMYLEFIVIVVVIKSELNHLLLSGIFEDDFIEERRQGLEAFVNRCDVHICIHANSP